MSNTGNGELCNIPLSNDGEQSGSDASYPCQRNYKSDSTGTSASNSLDATSDEDEEKQRLIAQVLERQLTLDDLSSRVDSVKVENLKLKSENQVLGQYIENLITASSVFQSASPKYKKK